MDCEKLKYYSDMIKQDPFYLGEIKNPPEELCQLAVSLNGHTLRFIKKPTDKMIETALKKNGLALQYVKKQTLALCTIACKQDRRAMRFINPKLIVHFYNAKYPV